MDDAYIILKIILGFLSIIGMVLSGVAVKIVTDKVNDSGETSFNFFFIPTKGRELIGKWYLYHFTVKAGRRFLRETTWDVSHKPFFGYLISTFHVSSIPPTPSDDDVYDLQYRGRFIRIEESYVTAIFKRVGDKYEETYGRFIRQHGPHTSENYWTIGIFVGETFMETPYACFRILTKKPLKLDVAERELARLFELGAGLHEGETPKYIIEVNRKFELMRQ